MLSSFILPLLMICLNTFDLARPLIKWWITVYTVLLHWYGSYSVIALSCTLDISITVPCQPSLPSFLVNLGPASLPLGQYTPAILGIYLAESITSFHELV